MIKYDIAIIGGGLAGLAIAIQSAGAGYSVVLFEKESYPHHKVCGEYISMESCGFLASLGFDPLKKDLPVINQLHLSATSGKSIKQRLTPGGFGISRYKIDAKLAGIAAASGAKIKEATKVHDVVFENDQFTITSSTGNIQCRVAIAAYGKRSNLDVKWKRNFLNEKPNAGNNLIGVKYHIRYTQPKNLIALHNFENGYCGISAVEENKYCLCYLTTAATLQRYRGIPEMEQQVLFKNPHIKKIFTEAEFLWPSPITISQISFDEKTQVENHLLMTGDTAGMITPLCGNGMSMALQSGKICFAAIDSFLKDKKTRSEMERYYTREWKKAFSKRLTFGRMMQGFFGKVWLTNLFISFLKPFPFISRMLISQSHGKEF